MSSARRELFGFSNFTLCAMHVEPTIISNILQFPLGGPQSRAMTNG
jgi:hypothetical protein